MAYEIAIQRLIEYKRLYVEAEFTDEGVFALDEVPEDYAGTFIARIEVVFAILFVDYAGRLRLQTYNPPEIKNKNRDAGLPLILDGRTLREGINDPAIHLQWRKNDYLPDDLKARAEEMWLSAERQMGDWFL